MATLDSLKSSCRRVANLIHLAASDRSCSCPLTWLHMRMSLSRSLSVNMIAPCIIKIVSALEEMLYDMGRAPSEPWTMDWTALKSTAIICVCNRRQCKHIYPSNHHSRHLSCTNNRLLKTCVRQRQPSTDRHPHHGHTRPPALSRTSAFGTFNRLPLKNSGPSHGSPLHPPPQSVMPFASKRAKKEAKNMQQWVFECCHQSLY